MPEVAALPVQELRLPLLAPSELATLESHNQRDLLIPVSCLDFGGLDLGFGGKLGPHSCPHPRWRASRQPGGPTHCGVAAGCPPSSAGPGAARGPATTTGTWTRTPSRGCAPPSPSGGLGERLCPPSWVLCGGAGCGVWGWASIKRFFPHFTALGSGRIRGHPTVGAVGQLQKAMWALWG